MQKLTPPRVLALAGALVVFAAAWFLLDVPPLSVMRQWAEHTGAWFPFVFWCFYVAITQVPIPRTLLTVSAGILFGPVRGIAIAVTATTVSAVVSLMVVRGLLRDFIEPRLTHPAVGRINARLEERGWLAVASLRMIAAVPFCVLNYACALTRVPVVPFALATLVGSAPGTVVVVLFGDTLTGHASPEIIVAGVALALVGAAGLAIDAKLPTKDGAPR